MHRLTVRVYAHIHRSFGLSLRCRLEESKEFDAIARRRGGSGGNGDQGDAGVARDSVVNQ
jgi:hypothetical protein